MPLVELIAHPSTSAVPARRVTVDVRRMPDGGLALGFRLEGRLDGVRIPPPGPPRRADGLWRHTCFEAFVALDGDAAYREVNVSPSGEWAVYAFRGYRDPLPLPDETVAPHVVVTWTTDRLALDATVPLPTAYGRAPLRVGLSAVVEATDGMLSYWALRHPPGAPDFHRADAFALAVQPLRRRSEGGVP